MWRESDDVGTLRSTRVQNTQASGTRGGCLVALRTRLPSARHLRQTPADLLLLPCISPAQKPTLTTHSLGSNSPFKPRESYRLIRTCDLFCRTFLLSALVDGPFLLLFHRSPSLPVRSDRDNTPQCRSHLALQLPRELPTTTFLVRLAPPSVPTIRLARTQDQAAVVSSET